MVAAAQQAETSVRQAETAVCVGGCSAGGDGSLCWRRRQLVVAAAQQAETSVRQAETTVCVGGCSAGGDGSLAGGDGSFVKRRRRNCENDSSSTQTTLRVNRDAGRRVFLRNLVFFLFSLFYDI